MRAARLPLLVLSLLSGCGTEPDPADPGDSCPACRTGPPVLALLCNDGSIDAERFAAHFEALEIVDPTGAAGYPDAELGARFSRKVPLTLRARLHAPVDAFVCVRSRTTDQLVFSQVQALQAPLDSVSLGHFERDHYVLHVRSGTTLLASLRFASE